MQAASGRSMDTAHSAQPGRHSPDQCWRLAEGALHHLATRVLCCALRSLSMLLQQDPKACLCRQVVYPIEAEVNRGITSSIVGVVFSVEAMAAVVVRLSPVRVQAQLILPL